jgi:prepilin-type N-terminal cleavage/methylation domain-containing protein
MKTCRRHNDRRQRTPGVLFVCIPRRWPRAAAADRSTLRAPASSWGSRKRAFSLIELLVCIAVIAILSALVFVALRWSGAKADRVHCASNLRQHGVALALFLSEKNFYPVYVNPGQVFAEPGASLGEALSQGLGPFPSDSRSANSVYFCPAFIKQLKADSRLGQLAALYGYNVDGLNGGGTNLPLGLGLDVDATTGGFRPVKESQIVAPSRMLAMGDGVLGWNQIYQDSFSLGRRATAQDHLGSTERVKHLHNGELNAVL